MNLRRPRHVLPVGIVLLASLISAGAPAIAQPTAPTPIATAAPAAPEIGPVIPLTAQPEGLTPGPDGDMWVVLSGSVTGDDVAKITPAGAITYYDLPDAPNPTDIVADSNGDMWVTLSDGVARFDPGNPTNDSKFQIPGFDGVRSITEGFGSELVAAGQDKVWTFDLSTPLDAEFNTVPGMDAREISRSSDRIWIADATGRLVAVDNAGTETLHVVGGFPQGVVAAPNGQILYTNPGTNPQTLGRLQLNGTAQLINVPNTDPSFSATRGQDGNFWVGLFLTRQMARVTPTGVITRFGTFPDPYKPRHVAAGPGGTIWVSLQDPGNTGAIGRVSDIVPVDNQVNLKVISKRLRFKASTRKATVKVTCPANEASPPCSGTLRLVRSGKKLGASKFRLGAGVTYPNKFVPKRPALRVSRSTLNKIRKARNGYRLQLIVRVTDDAGNQKTLRKRLKAYVGR